MKLSNITECLKAYKIDSEWSEGSAIAFAESPSKAKIMALYSDELPDEEYIELRAKRAYEFDKNIKEFGRGLLYWGKKSAKAFRDNGWFEFESHSSECLECGLYEFRDIPDSEIIETDEACICKGCLVLQAKQEQE